MRNKKIKFKFFTIPEYEKEQDYLRNQHKKGWKFMKVKLPGLYYFEKCEPEDVIYQLDYNKEGINNKEEYVQMFRDCGWEYLMDFVGYSYFRKPVSEMKEKQEEIFCDEASRLDMMKRVFRGRVTPLIIIFFCCIIPQMFIQYQIPIIFSRILFYMFVAMFILYVILFSQFGIHYWKLIRKKN